MSSQISCPANQLASSLLNSPWKGKGCPAWRQDFSTCRNREQAKLIHGLCFIMKSVRNTYFTEKFRPLNSGGEESSQPLLYPSLLPLLIAFFLVTLEKFRKNRENTVRGKHGDTREITKKDCSQQRVVNLSMPCLAFWSQMSAGNKEFKEWTPEKGSTPKNWF